jgi:uncharacterized membrane protein YphA (DoxX/SURF4 family)
MKNLLTMKNLGWLVTALVSFMLLMSGVNKVIGSEEMVNNFTATNLLPYLGLVGVIEIVGVCLLVYPKTTLFGAVGITSVMSAAAVIHLSYMGGAGVFVPVILGALAWVAHYLRK